MYKNIRVVLVETSHPGNIGATARAMKNMCLDQLYLVRPARFPGAEATARASGADDVLASAVICDDLAVALSDCRLVVGASARLRALEWPLLEPPACGEKVWSESSGYPVALLFGSEQSGLSNAELEHCQFLVHIPGNENYQSLNLAAAVQLIVYEVHQAARRACGHSVSSEHEPAPMVEMERFYEHLETALREIGFLDPRNPRRLMPRLRRLFNRARPDAIELNILRGILTAAQGAPRRPLPGLRQGSGDV